MDRRSVLKGMGATGLALTVNALEPKTWPANTTSGSVELPPAATRLIETPTATLHISERTGDLVGLHWKNPDLEVISEPRLGENFRVCCCRRAGFEADYFYSRDQSVSSIQATNDGVLCTYDSLRNGPGDDGHTGQSALSDPRYGSAGAVFYRGGQPDRQKAG